MRRCSALRPDANNMVIGSKSSSKGIPVLTLDNRPFPSLRSGYVSELSHFFDQPSVTPAPFPPESFPGSATHTRCLKRCVLK